jgi:TRAP-type C4-dicarboxylate transport system permease small subunit
LGRITVSLDEDCFAAWVLGIHLGSEFAPDEKYNLGLLVLQALLQKGVLKACQTAAVRLCVVFCFRFG